MWPSAGNPLPPRRAVVRLAIAIMAVIIVACAPDEAFRPVANPPTTPATPATPIEVGIAIVPESTTIAIGESLTLRAVRVMSDGSRVPIPQGPYLHGEAGRPPVFSTVTFSSDILVMNAFMGNFIGVGPGTVRTKVEFEGRVAFGWLTVAKPALNGVSTAMTVDHFSVIEYQYPQDTDQWYYAPQLTVSPAPGRTITVLTLRFHIPGLEDPIPTIACGARVVAGTSRALNGEVYGDWSFSVDDPGHQASGEDAQAIVSFVDDTGMTGTIVVRGHIVPGTLPTTYEGGKNGGGCFHGYGSG